MFKVFGKNPDLTISFLNVLLLLDDENKMVEVEYIKQMDAIPTQLLENNVVDVLCTSCNGSKFYAEIQTRLSKKFNLLINTAKNLACVKKYTTTRPFILFS